MMQNTPSKAWRLAGPWALAALLTLGGQAALAQGPADAVVAQLREQGYVAFEVSRTLLGRIRVVALTAEGGQREIILSPATGEILRDYVKAAEGVPAGSSGPMVPQILDRAEDDVSAGTTGAGAASDDEGPSSRGNGQGGGNGNDPGGSVGNVGGSGGGSGNSGGKGTSNGNRP